MYAQEAGCASIARGLHDSIGQSIALLTLQIPVFEESPPGHLFPNVQLSPELEP